MQKKYLGVMTRFLHKKERLIVTKEQEMPLVIEAKESCEPAFLQQFLAKNSAAILNDISHYGAVLFRGFNIATEADFEQSITHIQGFQGISEAFMSEEGRIHVPPCKYVLHTNAVYKTGGTLYLGGFHSENYYSADVPAYISFCCLKPSKIGGETGLIHMGKVYAGLNDALKQRLEKNTFFVAKWLVSAVAERYNVTQKRVKELCQHFKLTLIGKDKDQFILMYKPNVFVHPETNSKALQINFFEIPRLNAALRKCFSKVYRGKTWFWHRLVWKLPTFVFNCLEFIYVIFASFFYSPKDALSILRVKINTYRASKHHATPAFNALRVDSCFDNQEVDELAQLMCAYYSSCLWKQGDILLVDNRQVVHAGMPGAGPRLIRALIGNPLTMNYSANDAGIIPAKNSALQTLGHYFETGADIK